MFTVRTTRPEKGNKNYITIEAGGWSNCIKGKPTDPWCDVLSNCVGYACGRFNEIYNELTGHVGHKYLTLSCNAENFIERAKSLGLEISPTPTLGGILVWQKGATLSGADGAGHVAIVEKIIDNNTIYTSESNYGSTVFFNATRRNSNGRWGLGSAYTFRGCVVNPAVKEIKIINPIERNTNKEQINIKTDSLRVRMAASLEGFILGFAKPGYYDILEKINADGYLWVKLANDQYIAYSANWAEILPANASDEPAVEPVPEPYEFKIGDRVIANGKLYKSSREMVASGSTKNRITTITRYVPGTLHPYNTTGDIGWMDADSFTLYTEPIKVINKGDQVRVLKGITYTGTSFVRWYSTYDVFEVKGDRVVIGKNGTITAAVNINNIEKA